MVAFTKFFDLSQPVYEKCPGWPTYEKTSFRYEASYTKDGYTAEQITMNSHTGTHVDAPFHFDPLGVTVDELPVEAFCGETVILDLRKRIQAKEGISPVHLEPFAEKIKAGRIVILNTGWGPKRGFSEEYFHDWPYLSREGAEWLLKRKVKGVGIDGISMGGWYEGTGRPCHEVLLPAKIWLLEELIIPDALMEYESCWLFAFPIKLKGFSGAPVRAVAAV